MKNLFYYVLIMFLIIIMLPLLIVKGCNVSKKVNVPETKKGVTIKLFLHKDKKKVEMDLEEYIKGVVMAEMPADFEMEALKAQAIAARTYAYGRIKGTYSSSQNVHTGSDVCSDSTHCQAYANYDEMKSRWENSYQDNLYKIERAVKQTENQFITYNNSIINPLFHSNCGGKTENVEDVWNTNSVPYLKCVASFDEESMPNYKNTKIIEFKNFIKKIKECFPEVKIVKKNLNKEIKIIKVSESGRVKELKVGNIIITGVELRNLFNLRSTMIKLEILNNKAIQLTTFGYGHGVGMSQWGANSMAKRGKTCEEILKYYYNGVTIENFY